MSYHLTVGLCAVDRTADLTVAVELHTFSAVDGLQYPICCLQTKDYVLRLHELNQKR